MLEQAQLQRAAGIASAQIAPNRLQPHAPGRAIRVNGV